MGLKTARSHHDQRGQRTETLRLGADDFRAFPALQESQVDGAAKRFEFSNDRLVHHLLHFFRANDIVDDWKQWCRDSRVTVGSDPLPEPDGVGRDRKAASTGHWDGARGFHADPSPQTACSVLGTAPRVFVRMPTPNRIDCEHRPIAGLDVVHAAAEVYPPSDRDEQFNVMLRTAPRR